MATRRRRARRNWVSKQEHFWSRFAENQQTIANGVIRFVPIVAPTDWVVRDGFATCTMVRIRCSYAVAIDTTSGGNVGGSASMFISVVVVDSDDATWNILTAASRAETDILWTKTHLLHNVSDESGTSVIAKAEADIDIKVKRKLKADDFVYLTAHNATGYIQGGGVIWNMTSAVLLAPK